MEKDLEHPSEVHHVKYNGRDSGVHRVASGNGLCDKDQVGVTSCSISGADENSVTNSSYKVPPEDVARVNSSNILEPYDGKEFDSKEEAFSFYKEYARSMGFAGIIKASRRSRVSGKFIDARFVCTRYGMMKISVTGNEASEPDFGDGVSTIPTKKRRGRVGYSWLKTDCKACMHVKRQQDGRWKICSFIKEHNHEIYPVKANLGGDERLDVGDCNVGALSAFWDITPRQAGTKKKNKSVKSIVITQSAEEKHLSLEQGDCQVILDYLSDMQDENPNFFYAIDINKEQRLKNIVWVDAKGRADFANFNDVVFFDTTYIKLQYKLPFVPIIGVNHHLQFLSLGCALIADESLSTFAWLLRAWHRAMGGQAPRVILSDQDDAMKEAIAEVFPDSSPCYCLWHILCKVPEKLSQVLRKHENFMTKFNKCIYKSMTDQQVEKRWCKMVDSFDLRNNLWFRSLYEDRNRWMPTYMRNIFLSSMSTAQRSDSVSCFFDKYIQWKTTLRDFLGQYKSILLERYVEEAKADFESWHKEPVVKSPSPFGKQMAAIYTHAVFKKFQIEVLGVMACHPKGDGEDGETVTFKIQDFEKNQEFSVVWNKTTSGISCLCRSMEYRGFLCRHALIILQMFGVQNIPSQYILKRWTKDAKSRETLGQGSDVLETRAQRYKNLCQRAFRLGDEGSLSQESYNIALHAFEEALRKCEGVNNFIQFTNEHMAPSSNGPLVYNGVSSCSKTNSANRKAISSDKGKGNVCPEVLHVGMHDSWQETGHSSLQVPSNDCSYEIQERLPGMERLTSRAANFDGYFGGQQFMQGLESHIAPRHDYFSNMQNMPSLGQLDSVLPVDSSHYIDQGRGHGLESNV